MGMKIHAKYCSYIPALMTAFQMTDGAVLELGAGPSSTFFLHWLCLEYERELVTYENNKNYYKLVEHCNSGLHSVILVEDWDDADIERAWGVALVDHAPAIRRKDDIKRLAHHAYSIVIHDTQGRANKHYHYNEIFPLFKYRKGYPKLLPQTMILSNFTDVSKWQ